MEGIKKFLKEWLILGLITFVVGILWQGLELLIIGEIRPDVVDTIITYILSISIYMNIYFLQKK